MTKFKNLKLTEGDRSTEFFEYLDAAKQIQTASVDPEDFEEVIHIGYEPDYGDVFICTSNRERFTILFGKKGDEFD